MSQKYINFILLELLPHLRILKNENQHKKP